MSMKPGPPQIENQEREGGLGFLWWWPILVCLFSLLGLWLLYLFAGSLFLEMTPNQANIWQISLATGFLVLFATSLAATVYKYLRYRRRLDKK